MPLFLSVAPGESEFPEYDLFPDVFKEATPSISAAKPVRSPETSVLSPAVPSVSATSTSAPDIITATSVSAPSVPVEALAP